MKNKLFDCTAAAMSAVALLAGVSCTKPAAGATEEVKPWDCQAMSTYLYMGHTFVDSTFLTRVDFDNFDNVYLIDQPVWESTEDFDNSIDSILAAGGAAFPFARPDNYRFATEEAHKAGTKVLFTTGTDALHASCDSVRRAKFVKALVQAADYYDMDGVDVDWEEGLYPNLDKHTALMEELRAALDSLGNEKGRKYYLTTALSIECQYFPEELRKRLGEAVDWINMMSYDTGGGIWANKGTHNTPVQLYADSIESNWRNVPREKLHLGLASYGFQYHGLTPGETVPEGKSTGDYGHYVNYNTVVPLIYNNRNWYPVYDDVEKCYYFVNDAEPGYITCDTPETLMYKYQLAADKNLGGTFWWEYCKDIVPAKDGGHKWVHTLIPDHKRKESYK